jgi:hypothetical protein
MPLLDSIADSPVALCNSDDFSIADVSMQSFPILPPTWAAVYESDDNDHLYLLIPSPPSPTSPAPRTWNLKGDDHDVTMSNQKLKLEDPDQINAEVLKAVSKAPTRLRWVTKMLDANERCQEIRQVAKHMDAGK